MIYVLTHRATARLSYTLEVVFRYLLGVKYQLVLKMPEQVEEQCIVINYTGKKVPNTFFIPCSGFLDLTELAPFPIEMELGEVPLFFTLKNPQKDFSYDLFSAVFYLITEYEKQLAPRYDRHGRYDEGAYMMHIQKWHRKPLIHLYCEALWDAIKADLPENYRAKKPFEYTLTFDIDHPWKYVYKSPWVTLGGIGKRLLERQWGDVKEQLKALWTGKDPFDQMELIREKCPPDKTVLFFLIDRNSPEDTRYTYRHPRMRKLIQEALQQGFRIGIHPSYTSYLDPKRIKHEVDQLGNISKGPITESRQHYLRYRLPDTFRSLIEGRITDDYSLGLYSDIGFRTFIACPYPWFDLARNQQTALMLHPTIVMDRTLQRYLALEPEVALQEVEKMVAEVKAVNGHFTLLLHNDSLSESGEWRGWREYVLRMIQTISS